MFQAFNELRFGSSNSSWREFNATFRNRLDVLYVTERGENAKAVINDLRQIVGHLSEAGDDTVLENVVKEAEGHASNSNSIFYAILSEICIERAKAIVLSHEKSRSGARAFADLLKRYRQTEHTIFEQIFNFSFHGGSLEDKFRSFLKLMEKCPGTLPDNALESILLSGLNKHPKATSLVDHIKLNSPMKFSEMCILIEKFLTATRISSREDSNKPVPMDIGEVTNDGVYNDPWDWHDDHDFTDDWYDEDECSHINVVKGKGGKRFSKTRKGKGKSNSKGFSQGKNNNNLTRWCCGNKGHSKNECHHTHRFCSLCGAQGHMDKMCNKKGTGKNFQTGKKYFLPTKYTCFALISLHIYYKFLK